MRIRVDQEKCQGHARCYALAPDLFEIDDYGMSTATNDGVIPAGREGDARLVVANCPEYAIEILEQ